MILVCRFFTVFIASARILTVFLPRYIAVYLRTELWTREQNRKVFTVRFSALVIPANPATVLNYPPLCALCLVTGPIFCQLYGLPVNHLSCGPRTVSAVKNTCGFSGPDKCAKRAVFDINLIQPVRLPATC